MLDRWAEKVLRFCCKLCSSPKSTNTSVNTGNTLSVLAGICNPACAMSTMSPTVFNTAVLPPVLGPVMTSVRSSGPRLTSMGTGSAISGWRAPLSCSRRSETNRGATPCMRWLKRPLATIRSTSPIICKACANPTRCTATRAVKSRNTSRIARSSSACSCKS